MIPRGGQRAGNPDGPDLTSSFRGLQNAGPSIQQMLLQLLKQYLPFYSFFLNKHPSRDISLPNLGQRRGIDTSCARFGTFFPFGENGIELKPQPRGSPLALASCSPRFLEREAAVIRHSRSGSGTIAPTRGPGRRHRRMGR